MFDDEAYKKLNEGLVHMPHINQGMKPYFNDAADHEKVIVVQPKRSPEVKGGSVVLTPQTERKVFDVKCK